jgi:hypothetical protein
VNLPRVPGLPPFPGLDDPRQIVKRARREAGRWLFRAVLLTVIGALAITRGWLIFGVMFLGLAVMGFQLSRSTKRRAAELEQKLKLLEEK